MKKSFLHLLLAVLLLCVQTLAAAHVVEHAVEKGTPAHVCELCLAAHNLGSALKSDVTPLPVVAPDFIPAVFLLHARAALPAPQARQQAPPSA